MPSAAPDARRYSPPSPSTALRGLPAAAAAEPLMWRLLRGERLKMTTTHTWWLLTYAARSSLRWSDSLSADNG
jgi:hypothetical protein